jgi:hypothetical protein
MIVIRSLLATIRLRNINFLLLSGLALTLGAMLSANKGYLDALLPALPGGYAWLTNLFSILAGASGCMLISRILGARQNHLWARIARWAGIVPLLLVPLLFIEKTYVAAANLSDIIALLLCLPGIVSPLLLQLRLGSVEKRIVASVFPVAVGCFTFILWRHGFVPDSFLSYYALSIGYALGAIASLKIVRSLEALKSNSLSLTPSDVPLEKLFDSISLDFRTQLNDKLLTLSVAFTPPLSPEEAVVTTDPAILRLPILGNLLTHAIRNTPVNGAISIKVQHEDGMIAIAISDGGDGIKKAEMDTIRQMLDGKSPKEPAREPGFGLAISIAHSFVSKLNGSLRVSSKTVDESPTEHGTTVTILLPKAAAATLPTEPRENSGSTAHSIRQ